MEAVFEHPTLLPQRSPASDPFPSALLNQPCCDSLLLCRHNLTKNALNPIVLSGDALSLISPDWPLVTLNQWVLWASLLLDHQKTLYAQDSRAEPSQRLCPWRGCHLLLLLQVVKEEAKYSRNFHFFSLKLKFLEKKIKKKIDNGFLYNPWPQYAINCN